MKSGSAGGQLEPAMDRRAFVTAAALANVDEHVALVLLEEGSWKTDKPVDGSQMAC
jgi:hypothetical protein